MTAFILRLQALQLQQESACLFAPRLPVPVSPPPAIARLLERRSLKSIVQRTSSSQRPGFPKEILLVEGYQTRTHSLVKQRKLQMLSPKLRPLRTPKRPHIPSSDFDLKGW